MKNNVRSYFKLFPLVVFFTLFGYGASATPYYVQDVNPWGTTQNITCMNNVFGAGGWIQATFSTPAATIFAASTQFVMLEGSDQNSNMPTFVNNNITLIENWVNNGGRLFMNAAPNYGSNQTWGFSGTTLNYPSYGNSVATTVPANQIFLGPYLPTSPTYSGNSFAHAYLTGSGLTPLLYDAAYAANVRPVLCYKTWGNGIVFFGGCTQPNYWTPYTQGVNLWQNIFAYVNSFPLVGITTTVTGSPWCAGAGITVNYSSFNLAFSAGNQFKVQLSDALGSFASPTQIGIVTSTSTSGAIACTIPAAQPGGTAYRIRTVSTATAFTGADNGTNLTINPQLTPSVVITVSPSNNVCAGTNVTFTATVTNGGPTPTYQWKVNNTPVPLATNPTFSTSTLNNNDNVTCTITSNAPCAVPTTATSNTITMTINPNLVPTITITANPGTTICLGTPVTFTPNITNGGPGPTYQWYKNGNPVGTSPTYTDNVLITGDAITCTIISNAPCANPTTVTSAPLIMTVNPTVVPTVSISANPGNTICPGTNVTFSATLTNGGPSPTYSWKKNNVFQSASPTWSSSTWVTGDYVTCTVTSNATCATPATVTSNTITMTVTPTVVPTISISVSPSSTICAGTSVTFSATITNGGPSPAYVWKKNNVVVANTPTFTSNSLADLDDITCTMTSSSGCAIPATVTSNDIIMTVYPSVTPGITIASSPGNTICAGTMVNFVATGTNGGPSPTYQWMLNGNPAGTGTTYSNNTFATGDVVTCVFTSNANCAVPVTVTSNAITMIVNPLVTPGITTTVNPGNVICSGSNATFTATPSNGGPTPGYQWYLNGNPVSTSSSYQNNTLANNDVITCVLTSNANCATPTTATSTPITMTVNNTVVPTLGITASPGTTVCSNTPVTFTPSLTNGGPTPTYQWKVNGNPVSTNPTYVTSTLNNTDVVSCTVTSNATCATPAVVTSNFITMTITTGNVPTIVVTASPGATICNGTAVTYTAATTYSGPSPLYQWTKNGNPVGLNQPTYTDPSLNNNDVIACTMTSSAPCVSPVTVTSNTVLMTVNAITTPGVSVTSNTGDSICLGTTVVFTAAPVNGGPAPVYQWKKNGLPVGSNTPTYTDLGLVNNDQINCVMVSNDLCPSPASATSNTHNMTVTPMFTPAVSVSVTPGTIICTGSTATFTATATGAGPSPIYHWMKNGNPIGNNSPTYTDLLLNGGDSVSCIVEASTACVTKNTDTSAQSVMAWFNSGYLAGSLGTTETNAVKVTPSSNKINYTDCDLMVSVVPSGPSAVSGLTTVKVTLDNTVQKFRNQPYVQRHFDIVPDSNAANATATVTLYAYQSEFDAYNLVAGPMGYPLLPSFATDNGNVKVTTFHGAGNAPANYSGGEELIIPTSVSWDIANNWWVITFPVTGFSGFYIHTGSNFALAVSNVHGADGFSVEAYPNPVQDKVNVRINGNRAANSQLVVTDLTGRTIISVDMDNNKATVDMSGLASGMYMLRYSDDARTETVKITKQ